MIWQKTYNDRPLQHFELLAIGSKFSPIAYHALKKAQITGVARTAAISADDSPAADDLEPGIAIAGLAA